MRRAARRVINSPVGQRSKRPAQRALGALGFELVQVRRDSGSHLAATLSRLGVASAVDVGANRGQFGARLRLLGFRGPVLSLEPMSEAYAALVRTARADAAWQVERCAVGSTDGLVQLNVSGNSTSSSLLHVNEAHVRAEPTSATVRTESVPLRRLDDVIQAHDLPQPYFLKIDVQGAEVGVLDGAASVLSATVLVQVELSLRPLYEGGADYLAVLSRLAAERFSPIGVESAFTDPRTGDVLQLDVLACAERLL
jgi:FkbM family methyltransferase